MRTPGQCGGHGSWGGANRTPCTVAGYSRSPLVRLLIPQKCQDGQDPAMVVARGSQVELREDARDVLLDRPQGDEHALSDRLVRAALGHQLEHLALAWCQRIERVVRAMAPDELADHGRVERRATLADAANRRGELLQVGDPILEQVADPLSAF